MDSAGLLLGKLAAGLKELGSSRLFLAVLAIKIIFSVFFASSVMLDGFIPFVNYFVAHGGNPYNYFALIGNLKAFPYPTTMLVATALPTYIANLLLPVTLGVGFLNLLLIRIPVLAADVVIAVILLSWLPGRKDEIVKYYWCSPILFYINYFHGQLDAIPIALLFISIAFLFHRDYLLSFIVLGLGIASKHSLLVALPFMLVAVWRLSKSYGEAAKALAASAVTYAVLVLPFVSSGFSQLVLGASEQNRVFDLALAMPAGATLYVVPAAILCLFLVFFSYKKVNKDGLIMVLGLVFTILVTLVPPMPGWYYWSIPFITYFFIKSGDIEPALIWGLDAAYLAFFIIGPTSAFFESFRLVAPSITALGTPYAMFARMGLNLQMASDLAFTALALLMLALAYYIYELGVKNNFEYKLRQRPLMVGIGGDSGSGKTTTANLIQAALGSRQCRLVNGDDIHRWERNNPNWQKFTHLDPLANKLHMDLLHAKTLLEGKAVQRPAYDHSTGRFTPPMKLGAEDYVIFEGLHPFFLDKMRDILDLKIFMDPSDKLRKHWKIVRDSADRGYSKDKVLAQLESREKDASKYIQPQKEFADIVFSLQPQAQFEPGETAQTPPLALSVTTRNSMDLEPIQRALGSIAGVTTQYEHEPGLQLHTLKVTGMPTRNEIAACVSRLIPNLDELALDPKWEAGYRGVIQLVSVYFIGEALKNGPI